MNTQYGIYDLVKGNELIEGGFFSRYAAEKACHERNLEAPYLSYTERYVVRPQAR